MLFNSLDYLLFLPTVFLLYWFIFTKLRWQNLFIVIASYTFYGWWDTSFLFLIAFTTLCSYLSGLGIEKLKVKECKWGGVKYSKGLAAANIVLNLLILGVYKYFNFFSNSLAEAAEALGIHLDAVTLDLVLPVGISFYTFQALSYTIDVYKNKIKATQDIIAFFAFISFFPQLVAGPIERATNLLPQFLHNRTFDYNAAVDGLRQILWGLFKKVVVADLCAYVVNNSIWPSFQEQSCFTLLIGAFLFTIQIYGDFSGYSDIAIGTAKLFGITLMRNFAFPYFSRDIAEFWRRWHISLTTWFRDYIYIPLGGSRCAKWKVMRNTMIIFLVSGFWHGANWTFILWGAYHAFLFFPLMLLGKNRKYTDCVAAGRYLPSLKETGQMALTFFLAMMGWVIFRSQNITECADYFYHMFSFASYQVPLVCSKKAPIMIAIMLLFEWVNRDKQHGLQFDYNGRILGKTAVRWMLYVSLITLLIFNSGTQSYFIYFQF